MALLRTRRWLGFTLTVIVAIVAFGLLSLWQWHRADEKRGQRLEIQAAAAATPTPLAGISTSAAGIAPADEWRHVQVTGEYIPSSQILVRKRPLNAQNGFWVMTALKQPDGSVVWINRGWIPVSGDALSTPQAPQPPTGTVAVSGFLRVFDDTSADSNVGLPAGQVAGASLAALPSVPKAYPAYVQAQESSPAQQGLVALPVEAVDESRNVSYAMQWLLFAAVAIAGWFYFLHREAKEDAQSPVEPAAGPTGEKERQNPR